MFRLLLAFSLIFSVLPAQSQTQSWDDITWITEEFPPWSYTENGELKGFYIDLLEAIWVELGVNKTRNAIQVLPWARGIYYLEHRPGTALFSIAKSKSRVKLGFQWVGPVKANNRLVFTVKKDSQISISSMKEVNTVFGKQSIGVINKDISEEIFLENGGSEAKLHRLNSGSALVKMLVADRISSIYYKHFQTFYHIRALGYDATEFESIYVGGSSGPNQDSYFAFHKDTHPKLVESFRTAFKTLEEKGVINELLLKYSPPKLSSE